MPHKFNAERRHHVAKMPFKVTNWAQYEAGLRRRAGLAMWSTPEAIDGWAAAPRAPRGIQTTYSDSAMQTYLKLRGAFKLGSREAEGLMTSIVELLGGELAVPDHTTVRRRAINMSSIARHALPEGPLEAVIDGLD